MSNNISYYNDPNTFLTKLIQDNLNLTNLLKNETDKTMFLQDLYNKTITSLTDTLQQKENEINILKQKNNKLNMDIGSYIARNNVLTNEKNNVKKELDELYLKYNEESDEFSNIISIYNNKEILLKQLLEHEKTKFIELQKYLEKSYEELFKLNNTK